MKIYVVFIAARQINGEYIAIKTEKAFKTSAEAEAMLKKMKPSLVMPDNTPRAMKVSTPFGELECQAEIAVHEVELQE
jgi:hypothetical protein